MTGGDQTVIVEGAGNLVYKGNLNLVVSKITMLMSGVITM